MKRIGVTAVSAAISARTILALSFQRGLPGGTFNMAHRWAVPLLTVIVVVLIALVLTGFLGHVFR
jgi:uncharacterized membrane protein